MNIELPLCLCGCGMRVSKPNHRYIHYHINKVLKNRPVSEETRKKLSESSKGRKPNLGNHHSEESKNKISESLKSLKDIGIIINPGRKLSIETRRKIGLISKNIIRTEEWKNNISKSLSGKPKSADHVRKMSETLKLKHYQSWLGKRHTPLTKQKMRISAIKKIDFIFGFGIVGDPRTGKNEKFCLDELQKYISLTIIRNDHNIGYSIGYFPDGHIPELKLFIEFDERHHFLDEYKTYKSSDIERELNLASLGNMIFRIKENEWNNNKDNVIQKFKDFIEVIKC